MQKFFPVCSMLYISVFYCSDLVTKLFAIKLLHALYLSILKIRHLGCLYCGSGSISYWEAYCRKAVLCCCSIACSVSIDAWERRASNGRFRIFLVVLYNTIWLLLLAFIYLYCFKVSLSWLKLVFYWTEYTSKSRLCVIDLLVSIKLVIVFLVLRLNTNFFPNQYQCKTVSLYYLYGGVKLSTFTFIWTGDTILTVMYWKSRLCLSRCCLLKIIHIRAISKNFHFEIQHSFSVNFYLRIGATLALSKYIWRMLFRW